MVSRVRTDKTRQPLRNCRGFTLIELVLVIVISGILVTVAVRETFNTIDDARYEQTKKEMDHLALAIAGDPGLYANGARTDFGYVGDIGAWPPNLDALATNPGGYSTWDGPYMAPGFDNNDFKTDGWGTAYSLVDALLRSTGSGSSIDKVIAGSTSDLLSNTVKGYVIDADREMPGAIYKDSMFVVLSYPDGAGGTAGVSVNPNAAGQFTFTGVPIGNHTISVIYIPDSDTITHSISVTPRSVVKVQIGFPADLW